MGPPCPSEDEGGPSLTWNGSLREWWVLPGTWRARGIPEWLPECPATSQAPARPPWRLTPFVQWSFLSGRRCKSPEINHLLHLAGAPPAPALGWFRAHPEPCPSLLVSASVSETTGTCMGQVPPSPHHWILRADPMKPRVLWLLGAGGISRAWEGSQGGRGAPASPGLPPLHSQGHVSARAGQTQRQEERGREGGPGSGVN